MPTSNRFDNGSNFVPAPLYAEPGPRPDLVSSRAVVGAVEQLLALYAQQQQALEGEVLQPGEYGPGYSTAGELRERRLSSLMYLIALVLCTAASVGGLVLLARQLIEWGGAMFWLSLWVGLVGSLSMVLIASLHGREQALTREGIAHHMINAETELSGSRIEVQREVMLRALETQATLARAELETKEAQRLAHAAEVERLKLGAPAVPPQPVTQAAALFVRAAQWFERVLELSPAGEYLRLAEDGRLRKGELCILAERGGLTESQRQRLAAALDRCSPWLLTYDDNSKTWRVNVGGYPTAAAAVSALQAVW